MGWRQFGKRQRCDLYDLKSIWLGALAVTPLVAILIGCVLAGAALALRVVPSWRRTRRLRSAGWGDVFLFAVVVLATGALASIPDSLRRFDVSNQRRGVVGKLDAFRVQHPECFSGACDPTIFNEISAIAEGCYATRGELRTIPYAGKCQLGSDLVAISNVGVVLAAYGGTPGELDRWVVTKDAAFLLYRGQGDR